MTDLFCDPKCGAGCTRAAYDRANKEANALSERMGQGWEPVVWENSGWHYRVTNGAAMINPDARGSRSTGTWTIHGYSAWLNLGSTKHAAVQFITSSEDPVDALGFATQEARTFLRNAESALNAISQSDV